jgi:hypothetical protein
MPENGTDVGTEVMPENGTAVETEGETDAGTEVLPASRTDVLPEVAPAPESLPEPQPQAQPAPALDRTRPRRARDGVVVPLRVPFLNRLKATAGLVLMVVVLGTTVAVIIAGLAMAGAQALGRF